MKTKLLVLQETISLYNIPIYNQLAIYHDLTVAYTLNNENKNSENNFSIVKLDNKKLYSLTICTNNFFKFCRKFDVVITYPNFHHISFCLLPFIKRKFKVVGWTIGIRASYTRRYDLNRKKQILDYLFAFLLNKCDSLIFYMPQPIDYWKNIIDKKKIFVAHNTVEVDNNLIKYENKDSILFIGSLYKEKKIFELLNSYYEALKHFNKKNYFELNIIGGGIQYNEIIDFVKNHELEDKIKVIGPVFDEKLLSNYFSKALLCISPDQAGLSVLKSMAHGVPFVTRENSITGGERLNIKNGYNGILYNNKKDLINILIDLNYNTNKYLVMGYNANKYYTENATIQHMTSGLLEAITYVLKK